MTPIYENDLDIRVEFITIYCRLCVLYNHLLSCIRENNVDQHSITVFQFPAYNLKLIANCETRSCVLLGVLNRFTVMHSDNVTHTHTHTRTWQVHQRHE